MTHPRILIVVLTLMTSTPLAWAGGLSTSFADVWVDRVPVGKTVPARDTDGSHLVLRNTGDKPLRLLIDAVVPSPAQLKPVAIAIPDLDWIHIRPRSITVSPGALGHARISIRVPKEARYAGHVYQVMIWSHPDESSAQGIAISPALLSRLRFRTLPN